MKIALITDTHFGVQSDSMKTLNLQETFFRDTFFPYLSENGITTVIHLGDLFDRRKYVNFGTLNRVKEFYFDKIEEMRLKVHTILGNHDTYYTNTNEINSVQLLSPRYADHIVYPDVPREIVIDDCRILLSPWINKDNYEASIDILNTSTAPILMGHFEINGIDMGMNNVSSKGLEPSMFGRYHRVFSGHFHHQSRYNNIHYLGAPYQMTWADYGEVKGFHIFDTKSLDTTFIPNPKSTYHILNVTSNNVAFDYEKYQDSIVKVIVSKKVSKHSLDVMMESLYNVGISGITIIEEDVELPTIEVDSIENLDNTPTLMKTYIDSSDIPEKGKVNYVLQELYNEAVAL